TVTVTVDPTTGTAPYQYSFNGGGYGSTNTYTTTASGNVTVSVRDANLCIIAVPASVTVQPLDPPTIDNVSGTPIWCTPAANTTSTVTVTVSHGVGALHYEITSPASAVSNVSGATSGQFNLLPAGTYIFKVTDANGCTDVATYTIDALINITTAGQLINDVVCNGEANGSVKFDVDNFAGTYTATLTAGPTTGTLTQVGKVVTLTNLPVGTYTVQVRDNITGCTASASVTVGQPTALSLAETKNVHANCKSGAQVTVTAAGGTPDYKYAFITAATASPTAADYTNSNNAVLDPAVSLNWKAYVIDSKNCETFIPITIVLDPLPNNITTNVATQQCPSATGEYTFTVTVGNGIAPYEYSIGNGFQTSNTFTVNAPGNYTVTVRDANQCEVTVATPVTILPALQLDYTITALPGCVVTNNGVIRATASGGSASANYRYTLDGGVTITTTPAVFNNVTPGTHIIRVRDAVTGCAVQTTVFVAPATTITGLHLDKIDVTCNGGSNGSITATLDASSTGVNDNPVYVYRLTGTTALGVPVIRPNQTNSTFDNLQAGDYTVTVTSGRGCEDSEDIRINQFDPIVVATPIVVQYGCAAGTNTSNYATVTVGTVTKGSGTYTNYEFFRDGVSVQSGSQTVYTETDYLGGSYTVKVTDDAGCSGTSTAMPVRAFIRLDAINVSNVAITCISNEDITITVTSTGGTPALLNYTVKGTDNAYNQTKTNGNFTGLTVGSYIITVTNLATGCSLEKAYYVAEPNTFEIKAIPFTKEICFGTTNGSVDLTFVDNQLDPTNDAGPFNYTVTGPFPSTATITGTTTDAGPFRISNLAAGQYSVIARLVASPTCTVNTVFSIDQPATALTVTTEKDEITCKAGNNDGVIYAAAQGGWDTSYEYQLVLNGTTIISDYSATATFENLGAGTYTVNVRDSKGCPVSTTVTLAIPTPIAFTAAADATMLSCFGDKSGVIRVSPPTGGQGSNYLYTLTVLSNNPVTTVGPQISPVFDGLGIGRYTVTVTDGFSCTATSSAEIVITEPTLVKPALVKSREQTCQTLAQLTLSASGGTPPYTYSATEDFAIVLGTFATTTAPFNVPVGTYSYYVRDANGCKSFVTAPITIEPLVPLDLIIDKSGSVVRCQGDATASIFAEAVGGLGDYVYTLLGTTNNVIRPAQTNGTFENLPMGTYHVKVDSHDCSKTGDAIIISEPPTPVTVTPHVTDVTCFGANNGIIEIIATGGTGNIQYSISPDLDKFDSKFVFDKLAPGDYQVYVKDENLCGGIYNFTIANGNLLYATLDATSIQPELCAGENNASFKVDIFGGKPGYFVRIDNETAFVPANGPGGTSHTFSGLKGGKHTVYFTDSYGCGPMELVVETPNSVTIDPTTTETVYGCETNTTTVIFDDSNDVADLDFSLDNTGVINPDGPVFKDLAPGPHTILVRHTNGCEKRTPEFTIQGFAKLTLVDITKSSKAEVNIIRVQAAGGRKPYLYSFDGGPFTESNEFRIYESRIYRVVVRDQNGCEEFIDIEGKFIDFCLPNYFTPNGGNGDHTLIGPGCGALAYKNLTFDIFDRYGRVVAKYHVGEKWDGRYNGAELPTGDYWYVLKLNDEKDDREFVGHFTLYR
ncbi:T9SS type B sorting domain-containing protein, partial [Flavobacterium sp. ANB]